MSKLSIWSISNLVLSGVFIFIAFALPIFQTASYNGKKVTVENFVNKIVQKQISVYASRDQYIAVKTDADLKQKLKLNPDTKDYHYRIITKDKGFIVVVEPKIEALRDRNVAPKFYTYKYSNNDASSFGEWSQLQ